MRRTKLYASIFLVCLAGCSDNGCKKYDHPEIKAKNENILSKEGELVGTLPDERKVIRYALSMGDGNNPHWIYIVENSNTVTTNHLEQHGKIQVNHVEVLINGIKYKPEEVKEE